MFPFEKENRKQSKEMAQSIAENQALYRRVFDNPDGKAVLKDLEKRCFVRRTTYPGNDEIGQWGINEGRRSIYAWIINMLEKDLNEILKELLEV